MRWLCRCSCGNEKIIAGRSLLWRNPTQSCGCIPRGVHPEFKDNEKKRRCTHCKEVFPKTKKFFHRNNTDPYHKGFEYCCKKCHKLLYPIPKNQRLLSRYRLYDKKKKLENDLDLEFIENILKDAKCAYCETTEDLGLDRADSKIGHIKTNCYPCCIQCNRAKSDYFSFLEMKTEIGPAIKRVRELRLAQVEKYEL